MLSLNFEEVGDRRLRMLTPAPDPWFPSYKEPHVKSQETGRTLFPLSLSEPMQQTPAHRGITGGLQTPPQGQEPSTAVLSCEASRKQAGMSGTLPMCASGSKEQRCGSPQLRARPSSGRRHPAALRSVALACQNSHTTMVV